jgi:hypothetical protein
VSTTWRKRCPEGHASWQNRAPESPRSSSQNRYYCEICGDGFDTLYDAKTGEPFDGYDK